MPPVQGFQPPVDTEAAMRATQTQSAIAANERAFPVFAKKLASKDPEEYANTIRKLATWLASEKAYYPGARPKIVELLEIAHSAFRDTFANHPSAPDSAQLLQQLVQTLVPFIRLFSEAELLSRVQRVMIEAERSLSQVAICSVTPTITANLTTPNIPPLPSSSSFSHSQSPMLPASSPQKSLSHPSIPLDTATAASNHPNHAAAPPVCNPAGEVPRQSDASTSITRSPLSENMSSSLRPKPQPTRTRTVNRLSEQLIARDLDWFKSNQAPAADFSSSSSRTGEPFSALQSDAVQNFGRSPNKKTARIIPSRCVPRRTSTETSEQFESGASPIDFRSTSELQLGGTKSLKSQDPSVLDINAQQSPPERTEQATATSEIADAPRGSLHEESREPSFPSDRPFSIPQTDYQPQSLEEPSGESGIPHDPSAPLHDAVPQTMDGSVSDSKMIISESPGEMGSFLPQSPQPLRLRGSILPCFVGDWEPPLNLDFKIPQISPPEPAANADHQRFGGEMAIFHAIWMKTFTDTHIIEFDLNESMFSKISMWINRKSAPSDAPRGVCLSLACYCLAELYSKIELGNDTPDLRALTLQSPCAWPHSNRLSLHATRDTRQTIIPLSPPLFLTPSQCVDITSLVGLGHNKLEIKQQGDLSQYLIVLHAHRPTPEQLAEVGVIKAIDERWKMFLEVVSAQRKPLGTIPAGVVGVL